MHVYVYSVRIKRMRNKKTYAFNKFFTLIGVYAVWLMEKTNSSTICRLKNILGAEGKYNDVLFKRCSSAAKSDIIFFGGDLQVCCDEVMHIN